MVVKNEDDLELLRALKGPSLSCLFALALAGDTVSAAWLTSATGHGHGSVEQALRVLCEEGLVERMHRYGWRLLNPHLGLVQQFWNAADRRSNAGNQRSRDITTTATNTEVNEIKEAVVVDTPGNAGIQRPDAGFQRTTLHELALAGIGEPMRSRLASLGHVTPDYVKAHTLLAKEQGLLTGLLITRIRCGDPAPALNEIGHLRKCECEQCRMRSWQICAECHSWPCRCEG